MYGKNTAVVFALVAMVLATICYGRYIEDSSEQDDLKAKRAKFLRALRDRDSDDSDEVARRDFDFTHLYHFFTDNRTEFDIEALVKAGTDLYNLYEAEDNKDKAKNQAQANKVARRTAHGLGDIIPDPDNLPIPTFDDIANEVGLKFNFRDNEDDD